MFLLLALPGLAESGGSADVEAQDVALQAGLPDMQTEAGIREYLTGEWRFYDPTNFGYNSCRMLIDKEMNVEFEFYDGVSNAPKGIHTGIFTYGRIFASANDAPDIIRLELADDGTMLGGDFFFVHRTIFDGRCVMSLFSAGNGGCVLDLLDQSDENGWGICPVEMYFTKETGGEYQPPLRMSAEFHAVYWGGYEHGIMWLDDIDYDRESFSGYDLEEIGSFTWYRYLITAYDNEIPVSAEYMLSDDLASAIGGDLRIGDVCLVKTDEHSGIIDIQAVAIDN